MASFFGGRNERYKLSNDVILIIDGAARDQLLSEVVPYCHDIADNIRDAANATSSWGGYESYKQDGGASVSAFNSSDSERGRRLLAALGTELV